MTSTSTPLSPEERAALRALHSITVEDPFGHRHCLECRTPAPCVPIRLLDQVEALENQLALSRAGSDTAQANYLAAHRRAGVAEERVKALAEAVVYAFSKSEPDEGSRYRVALDAARQALAGGGPDVR